MAAVEAQNTQTQDQIGRFVLGRVNFWLLVGFQILCAGLTGATFAGGTAGAVASPTTLWADALRTAPLLWGEISVAVQSAQAVDWAGAARLWAAPTAMIGPPILGAAALAWEVLRGRTPHVLQLMAAGLCFVPFAQFALFNSAAAPILLPKGALALSAAGLFLLIGAIAHRPRDALA
jgi:hypothetical protein